MASVASSFMRSYAPAAALSRRPAAHRIAGQKREALQPRGQCGVEQFIAPALILANAPRIAPVLLSRRRRCHGLLLLQ